MFLLMWFLCSPVYYVLFKDVGLEQCEMHLNKRTDPLFSTAYILEALDITLSYNLTTFEEKMYKQIKRTAMVKMPAFMPMLQ